MPSRAISSRRHGHIHQDRDQRGGFYGGVPAIDVVGGVGFGDAERLRFLQGFVEGEALLHLAEDHVGRRVEDSVEALQVDRGELVEERKDGDAVHDRGFEEESFALLRGQVAEFAVGVDDGAFVGGDGVGSVLECGADVVDGGLAVLHVERGGFEEDVGLGGGEPVADALLAKRSLRQDCRATDSHSDPRRLGSAIHPRRREATAGDAVGDAVAVAEFFGAVFEQADQSPVDVAEAEEAEVVGADATSQGLKPIDF